MLPWPYITQMFLIYVCAPFIFLGTFSCVMNMIILSTVTAYRTQPSTFFLLISTIANFLNILCTVPFQYLAVFLSINVTTSSLLWCKCRQYIALTCGGISFACVELMVIDQFLITSRSARLRQLSKSKWAHRIVAVIAIFWCCHNVPFLIFVDIR